MKSISLAVISALAISAPLATQAQYEPFDDRAYIHPFASVVIPEGDRNADVGPGPGFAVGKPINPQWDLEFRGMYEHLNNDGGINSWHNWTVGVDALYYFRRQGFQPFLLIGAGSIRDQVGSNSDWSLMGNAGAGFLYPINDNLQFRADARYRWDNNQGSVGDHGDFGDGIVSVGLQIPLGEKPRAPAPTPVPPPAVRKFELSADTLFAFNKATLMPRGESALDDLVQELGKASYASVMVEGYTDPIGSDNYNLDLSQRRANTVVAYLTSKGVPSSAIRAQGRGETNLKVTPADCSSAKSRAALIECYQPNRRVEVTATGEAR
jgi:OOP family OmpA-OmpF porin